MEYIDNTRCISVDELSEIGLSYEALKKLCQRKQVHRIRKGCLNTPALYDLDSLPWRYKVQVYERYPDLKEREESKMFVDEIELDMAAVQYYAEYLLSDGRHLPLDKQSEYANNASILNAYHRLITEADGERIKQSQPRLPRADFWRRAAEALPRIEGRWANSLPRKDRSLQRKYNEYNKRGYEALVSAKFANRNALKIEGEEQEGLLLSLIGHYNNLDDTAVAALYNKIAEGNSWEAISSATVRVWRRKHNNLIMIGRKGVRQHRAHRQMTVKRSKPTAACYIWSMDGWTAELLYKDKPRGGGATTYHKRKTVVVVLDPCCNYPVGYAVGDHESPALIKAALRNAILHIKSLTGTLLRVNQLQTDNYAIKSLTPLYAAIAARVTPASVGNAKAKPVESYFDYLNTHYCQTQVNWAGKGVTSRGGKQPNQEALNLHRKYFPTSAEVVEQIAAIIEEERRQKLEEYKGYLNALSDEYRLEMPRDRYLLHFGLDTGKTIALEANGFRPTLLGARRDYDCFDPSLRECSISEKWTIKYDPDDLDTALAVNADGSRQYLLEAKEEQPMALVERKPGDAAKLARIEAYNKELERKQVARLTSCYDIAAGVIDQAKIKGFLGGCLLVDSKGQHKDQRSKEIGTMSEEVDYEEDYEEIVTSQVKDEGDTALEREKKWLKKL